MSQEKEADENIEEIESQYEETITDIQNGILLVYGSSLLINENKSLINELFDDSDYKRNTSFFINDGYQKIYNSSHSLYKEDFGESWDFSKESLTILDLQKKTDLEGITSLKNKYISDSARIITQGNVNKLSRSTISQQLSKLTNTYKNRVNTFVDTSYSAMLSKSNILLAEDNGIKEFKYTGPSDGKTRQFCREQIGKTKTIKEWDLLDNGNGQPDPVSIYRGGWNCRHILVGVTNGNS